MSNTGDKLSIEMGASEPGPNPSPQESILIARSCMRMRGPLGFKGTLELTSESLSFKPTERIDKMVGASGWSIPVSNIVSAEIRGLQRALIVEGPEGSERFMGEGARQLQARLASLLRHLKGETSEDEAYTQSERVLMNGAVNRYVTSVVAVPGSVELTDRRLRFRARRGLETLIWREADLDVELESITSANRGGAQMKLVLTFGDEEVQFEGGVSALLYARLVAQFGEDMKGPSAAIVDSWVGSLCNGPVQTEVNLVFSTQRVVFGVRGSLDAVVGFRDRVVPLSEVSSVSVSGWPEPHLHLGWENNDPIEIVVPKVQDRFGQFIDALVSQARNDVVPSEQVQERTEELLADSDIKLWNEERPVLLTPVLQWVSSAEAERGWLAVTSDRMLLLPWDRRDAASGSQAYNFDQLERDDVGNDDYGQSVNLNISGEPMQLTLVEPGLHAETVFSHLDLPPPGPTSSRIRAAEHNDGTPLPAELAPESMLPPSSRPTVPPPPPPLPDPSHEVGVEGLQGRAIFLRLIAEDGKVLTLRRRAALRLHSSGKCFVVPGLRANVLPAGSKVKVALGRVEGLYAFVSRVIEPPNNGADARLLLKIPKKIRSFDRRRFFRQAMRGRARLRRMSKNDEGVWEPQDEYFEAELVDVSRGGIAIRTAVNIAPDEHVLWFMPDGTKHRPVQAKCVRTKSLAAKSAREGDEPSESAPPLTQFGLEFLGEDLDLLATAVDRLVDEEVRQRWFARGVREETGFQSVFQKTIDGWTCEVEVDPRRPEARLSVRLAEAKGKNDRTPGAFPVQAMKDLLVKSGIAFSSVEARMLGETLRRLGSNPESGPVIIARGIEPVEGHSGQVHWQVPVEGGERLSIDGIIDHREVEMFVNVSPEALICEVTEPHYGLAGRDVFGDPIPPPALPNLPIRLGTGVSFDQEKRKVVSTAEGCVQFDGDELKVVQVFTVKGDVDFNVGNIEFEGNVVVTGNVIEGFRVTATGDVDVGGIVEEATIIAGGSIAVDGGVTGHNRATIRAGGDLRARYLNSVNAQVGGHINIERQIRNCNVKCGATVLVQRGGIVGGQVRAAGSVQAVSLGSPRGIATFIGAGTGLTRAEGFGKSHAEIRAVQRKIDHVMEQIGPVMDNPEYVARLDDRQRRNFEKHSKLLEKLRSKLEKLETVLEENMNSVDATQQVVSTREAFANSQIQIGSNYVKQLDRRIAGEQAFCLDEEVGMIVAKAR